MRDAVSRENAVAAPEDAPAVQDARAGDADQPWSVALVRAHRDQNAAAGEAPLVLQGVYEASDEATLAAAMADHILEDLRRHMQHGWLEAVQPGSVRIGVRITIERQPDLRDVPPPGFD